jgi:hypothetical protein
VLPVTAAAALDGTLSSGQLRAIVANVSDKAVELLAGHEADLIPTLAALPTADVVIAMRAWAALAEDSLDDGETPEPSSRLHLSTLLEGRWRLDGDLEALDGEIIATALRLATGSDDEAETPRTPSERRAEALVDICRAFLEGREHPSSSRHRPHVNVIVTAEDLEAGRGGECADGTVLDGPSLASLVCDSVMHRVMMAGSVVLDYGTSTRVVSANLFNALVVRDRHCRFPGCDRPPMWTDAHHVVHVDDGGPTKIENLCLLCRRHHRRLHRPGWSAVLRSDATLVVTDPSGRLFTSHPPGKHPRPPPAMLAA